jgi:hypothetical protein
MIAAPFSFYPLHSTLYPLLYLLPGGTIPFIRRYSTICP